MTSCQDYVKPPPLFAFFLVFELLCIQFVFILPRVFLISGFVFVGWSCVFFVKTIFISPIKHNNNNNNNKKI